MQVLVFRSYGDLIILLNVLQKGIYQDRIHLKISAHLQALIENLPDFKLPDTVSISYFDIGINRGILRLFTNKDLLSIATIKELLRFKKVTNTFSTVYIEQTLRARLLNLFFYPKRFIPIVKEGNVYDAYRIFFSIKNISPDLNKDSNLISNQDASIISSKRILLFPDSRKTSKQLPTAIVNQILMTNNQVIEARFGEGKDNNQRIYYSNFSKLIEYIKTADYIISTDSLPVHLAYYLGVPHYILYAKKVNYDWLTPYAKELNSYGLFEAHQNLNLFLKDLNRV